MRDPDAR
jgi:PIN domain nuclease of toxin-antitoxin system/antitoxin (DNA-binding transcriptional repressor) of toxin-antitoxin stability system